MPPASSLSLETLERERERLEALLATNADWQALCTLVGRDVVDATERCRLEAVLGRNRLYLARQKIIEAIDLLANETAEPVAINGLASEAFGSDLSIAQRIVLIEPVREAFRTRVKIKSATAATEASLPPDRSCEARSPAETAAILGNLAALTRGQRKSSEEGSRPSGAAGRQPETPPPALASTGPASVLPPYQTEDRLELIAGIDVATARQLRAAGINRFRQIADWTAADVAGIGALLGDDNRPQQQGWIEQAALLASNKYTRYAARVMSGERTALVPPPPPQEWTISPPPVAVQAAHQSSDVVTAAVAAGKIAAAIPARAESEPPPIRLMTRLERLSIARPPAEPSERIMPPPLPDPRDDEASVDDIADGELSFPQERFVGEADVVILPDTGERRRPQRMVAKPARPRGERHTQHRFDGDSYAGYHADVEEASVEIIRPEDKQAGEPEANASETADTRGREIGRFLRALGS